MRREIATEIIIDAPVQQVWEMITDFPRYPEWNHFLLWVQGQPSVNTRIRFKFELPRGIRVFACAKILKVIPESELRWAGGIRGLFRAEHYFLFEPINDKAIRFRHGEIFTGILVPLIWSLLLERGGPPVYKKMNNDLKERAEKY